MATILTDVVGDGKAAENTTAIVPEAGDLSAREARRRERVAAIQSGALVRQQLGQRATYRRLDDGQHRVTVGGMTYTGATLAETIQRAQEQRL